MSLGMFEVLCAVVVVVTLTVLVLRRGGKEVLLPYGGLALAACIGENSCIEFYDFYRYAPGWHMRIGHVPVLITLIWPLVVLSARDVAQAMVSREWLWFWGALVVFFDATLMEVVAVRAGFWGWAEGGHLGVPLIGVLGWGFFAGLAIAGLQLRGLKRFVAVVVVAPVGTHLLLLVTWWSGLRWVLRGPLAPWSWYGMGAISAALAGYAIYGRLRGRCLDGPIAGPRVLASSVFVALLVTTMARSTSVWAHLVLVAVPYLVASAFVWRPRLSTALAGSRPGYK